MYALIYNTYDYTNVKFITHLGPAMEEFEQEKEENITNSEDSYCIGLCLIHIKGDGNFHLGQGFSSQDNVEILAEWEIEN